jgi:hypothetical protein
MNNQVQSDNRQHPRFPIDASIIIIDGTNGKIYSGICCNISSQGLLISCEDDLPENTLLNLEIREAEGTFIADGYVVRKAKGNNVFLIGLRVEFRLLAENISGG